MPRYSCRIHSDRDETHTENILQMFGVANCFAFYNIFTCSHDLAVCRNDGVNNNSLALQCC